MKRVRRIYPIFLCALLVGYLSEAIIRRAWFVPNWKTLAGNLAMWQGIRIDPFYDGPLWSLSYEWWFYVLFFVVATFEKRPERRQYWAAAISLLGVVSASLMLNQASLFLMYFMIWWCGAELARQYVDEGRITWRKQTFPIGALLCVSVLSLIMVARAVADHQQLEVMDYPLLFSRHLFSAVVLICIGIIWHDFGFFGFDRTLGRFSVLASISYGIYVLHFPIIDAVNSFDPGRHAILKICVIASITLGVAYILEIKLQSMVNRISKRLLVRDACPFVPVSV